MNTSRRSFSPPVAKVAIGLGTLSWLVAAPQIASAQQITVLGTFSGLGNSGINPLSSVTIDASGNIYGTTLKGGGNDSNIGGDGAVYEIDKGSSTITTIASFNGSNGQNPHGGVTFDSSGNLFGTTYSGGTSGYGTVYEIAKGTNSVTNLASFTGSNGFNSIGNVIFDGSGNLYGTANNTVYEIVNGSNTITPLANFNLDGSAAGLTLDSNGNLYGTLAGGVRGDAHGSVFEIAKGTNAVSTVATFDADNGSDPESGVIFDSNGNLFGTTRLGGASNDGAVYEIVKGSNTVTDLASFDGFTNGSEPFGSIALDGSGDLFGTTTQGGAYGHFGTVYEIAKGSNAITTLASFNGSNGYTPQGGVTLDSSGNLFGSTRGGSQYPGSVYGTVYEIAGAGSSPVPETSSAISLGLLLTLGSVGVFVGVRRRKSFQASVTSANRDK